MKIEMIKKVKLLVSLKGTEGGKPIMWLAGTVFDKSVKPFPAAINAEFQLKRIGVLEVLEIYPIVVDEPVTTDTVKISKEETPDPEPIVKSGSEEPEAPKGGSSKSKPSKKSTRRRR